VLQGETRQQGNIKIHEFTLAVQAGSDWWFSKILRFRTG